MENWNTIKGFTEYEVSDQGNIRKKANGRVLKKTMTKDGAKVSLVKNNKRYFRLVNRIVAEAFMPKTGSKVIYNIDGDEFNNAVSNLALRDSARKKYVGVTCSDEDCKRPAAVRGMCHKHYNNWYFFNATNVVHRNVYEIVGYKAAHKRLHFRKGIASDFFCKCGKPADDWALLTLSAETLYRQVNRHDANRVYSLNMDDYEPMCRPCHHAYDRKARGTLISRFNDCIQVSIREREMRTEHDFEAIVEEVKEAGQMKSVAAKHGVHQTAITQWFRMVEGMTFREWKSQRKAAA